MQAPQQPDQSTSQPLTLRQRLRYLPFIGPVLGWASSILRINQLQAKTRDELDELRQLQQAHLLHFTERVDRYDNLGIENRFAALEQQLASQQQLLDQRMQQLEALDIGTRLTRLEEALAAIPDTILPAVLPTINSKTAELDNRIASLIRELRRVEHQFIAQPASPQAVGQANAPSSSAAPTPVTASTPATASSFDMESFYVAFEDKFRGTRDDIQGRLQAYLPYVSKFAGQADARVVDIGCGRGEWLELLKQHDIAAIGVDLNSAMVDVCRSVGLQAEYGDAVEWLRRQPEGSLAAVTGFHIIEHLPFETMVAMFDAALHALRPDGLIIFETPNPENVIVGSCNFYYDPTHQHPLVPTVIEFLARQRGFAHAEILRMHPFAEDQRIHEDTDLARRLNHLFYGPQDFTLLAWKTHEVQGDPVAAVPTEHG
ncbi:hypothetical protein ASE07_21455 [Noviherbaspirillum sp. Root189]|nr:hypothetical protein ASE07_21455 [Noviherbaspirillum sp. Root189]